MGFGSVKGQEFIGIAQVYESSKQISLVQKKSPKSRGASACDLSFGIGLMTLQVTKDEVSRVSPVSKG
jgi:hypothetical protein